MARRLRTIAAVLAAAAVCGLTARAQEAAATGDDSATSRGRPEPNLRPPAPQPVAPEALETAIRRGIAFLIKDQNADGSWGTAERTKDLNIIAGVGSHHGFRAATTALCISALIELDDGSTEVWRAIERGEAWLFRELPRVRRDDPMLIYNVWAHGYAIQALVDMYNRKPEDSGRRERIVELIRGQYDRLSRYESAEGGWGYYDFNAGTQRPTSDSTSFVNAAVLIAFHEAKQLGIAPPERVTRRAIEATRLQRLPDFSYLYGSSLKYQPRMGINRPGGSLGRTQACNLALRLWGDAKVTDAVVKEWLDRLITRNGWLDLGRKRPIPHESFFMVAGYFYYFGHYYACLSLDLLPPEDRPFYQDHLAHILIDRQDADGSWWDYPLYNYHQQYGTAYALMSLKRCRKGDAPRAAVEAP
jgi:hypothetical protein